MEKSLIRRKILVKLYEEPLNHYKEKLKGIIAKNNQFNGSNSVFGKLLYKGRLYSYKPKVSYLPTKLYDLDESLKDDMESYHNNYMPLKEEHEEAKRFLAILLTFCNHKQDVQDLLGDTVSGIAREELDKLIKQPREPHELKEFKDKYQDQIDMLQQRYLSNIVMRNVYNGEN
jgi:hypothetical protein